MEISMKTSIAIITARGGSKRIPRKNIRNFCGRPILAYSIEAALSSGIFDEVMVSTDDAEIARIAEAYGANVPFFRSAETANDYATTADVLSEVFEKYHALGKGFQYGCCIYPTAPFVTAEKLKNAMGMLLQEEAVIETDSVIPVTSFSFPPMRGFFLEEGNARYAFPEFAPKRSQDILPMYHDCGQFYCFSVKAFLKSKKLVTANTKAIIMPEMEVQDIDNEQDWQLAELKYRLMRERMEQGQRRHPMEGEAVKELQGRLMGEKAENANQEHRCFLRRAEWKDVDQLFQWANEEEVRKNSFSTAPIPYEEHKAWFEKKLKEEHTQIYIFCDGTLAVGALRLEFGKEEGTEGEEAVISYSIAAEHRNQGYGQKLISLAEQEACKWAKRKQKTENVPGKVIIKAQVRAENKASRKIFMKAGYGAYEVGYQKAIKITGR